LARDPTGRGPRRHDLGPPLDGLGHQGRLSRLCHAGGQDARGRHPAPGLAPRVAAHAAPAAAGDSPRLDGDRAGGSGPGRRLVVSPHRPAGLAAVVAPQGRRHRPAGPAGHRPPVDQLRAPSRQALAGHRYGLQGPPAASPVDVAGLRGGGLYRPLVDSDRGAARRQRGRWVWLAGLDRTGLEGDQTGGRAVATPPPDRAAADGWPVAGGGGGHPVAAERGAAWPRSRVPRAPGSMSQQS
jgi:hypothetical protein